MWYVLSKGSVLRREWFGCLYYQTYTGCYRQFNIDAFEILQRLATPKSLTELQQSLLTADFSINQEDLASFIEYYQKAGIITEAEKVSEVKVFYQDKTDFRTDCLVAPSTITLYSTDFCPKHCRHCATESHPGINPDQELNLLQWTKIIQNLNDSGVISLIISGGEPLAIPHTLEILKIADKLSLGLTLLTDYDDISKAQLSHLTALQHPLHIQTSLDGATAETHDFLRGNGSFAKTLRRLQLLKDANLNFTVAVAVHKKNLAELDKIAELAQQYGASFVYLNAVAPYGRAKKNMPDLILSDDELKQLAQTYLRWTATGMIKTRNPFWKEELKHLDDDEFHPLAGTLNAMSLGIYNFTINSRGFCYLDAKQRAENFLLLGNILETDLLTMWNDPRLDKLRALHDQKKFTFAEQAEIEALLLAP